MKKFYNEIVIDWLIDYVVCRWNSISHSLFAFTLYPRCLNFKSLVQTIFIESTIPAAISNTYYTYSKGKYAPGFENISNVFAVRVQALFFLSSHRDWFSPMHGFTSLQFPTFIFTIHITKSHNNKQTQLFFLVNYVTIIPQKSLRGINV